VPDARGGDAALVVVGHRMCLVDKLDRHPFTAARLNSLSSLSKQNNSGPPGF
jgi:hypothetical protein